MASVRLENINRIFNKIAAIADISFEIPDGEFWVLVGPSGCGKSTILRTIAGLESATSGNLYIGDRLINDVPARQRDVAMVFQNYALYPHMTVAQNIGFGLKMRNLDSKIIQQRVLEVARSLSLEHLLERTPKQLSGGQQQRVALGRAIARQAEVFLLDEPLSNLDAQLRDDTRAELKQIHHDLRNTTVYVTHDQVEAMTLADKIVVLEKGRIQQIGEPQEIYNHPANRMVATFIGNPPMNMLPAKYLGEQFDVCGQIIPIPDGMTSLNTASLNIPVGTAVELGIRPEYMLLPTDRGQTDNPTNPTQNPTQNQALLQVEVKIVEPLGRETLIRAGIPGSTTILNIQTRAPIRPQPGEKLTLCLDLNHLFVFDSETGKRLFPIN